MIELPQVPSRVPRTHGPLVSGFGRLMLTLAGWKIEGNFPDTSKMVLIVAPHTSNWDFPLGLMAKFALRLECRYIAKKSLFWWPLGAFMRAVGGVAIDRSAAGDVVEGAARAFRERPAMVLVITPEGTRSKVERWKSGFHRIALATGAPVALAVFDYSCKVIRLGPSFEATPDYERDLAAMQTHVTASMARHPENY